jgi:hypothetical protein
MLTDIYRTNGSDYGSRSTPNTRQTKQRCSLRAKSTKYQLGDLLYLIRKDVWKFEKVIVAKITPQKHGGPHYFGAILRPTSGVHMAHIFDDSYEFVYKNMDEALVAFNTLAKTDFELTMDPLTLSKKKTNVYYLEDNMVVRCFVSEVNDHGYTLEHFDEEHTKIFCTHGEERVFYKNVRSASRAKLLNDDIFKLDFIREKVGRKLFYLKEDDKGQRYVEKCKIKEIHDDAPNQTRIYTLQPNGEASCFQVSGSNEFVFFSDANATVRLGFM